MHAHPTTHFTDLSQEALIRVSGPDAVTFLQGQLSTDIEQLTPDSSQLSSWSNAKGRVVTLLRLFRHGDDIYLSLPSGLLPMVLKKLGMYVLRSKVTLTDASMGLAGVGLWGEGAPALLEQTGIAAPPQTNDVSHTAGVTVIRLHGETPRYALYGAPDAISALRARLEPNAAAAGYEAWALAKILAGEPTVNPETTEHFVAQMLDLDQLGGIDFKKGCYIGQEVIARAHYRGGVKRHLVRATSRSTVPLRPGADIHAADQESPVAEVVDARLDASNTWQILMVLQDDAREARLVHAFSGAAVTLA
ncbi:MAG TPA: folate-binding protein [Gammaproteobacteria bacterium]|nr:folate-binding protein [Gammaproteobacteria bacterium]